MTTATTTELVDNLASAVLGDANGKKAFNRDPAVAEFFGFESKHRVFTFDRSGKPTQRKLEWPEEPVKTPVIASGNRKPVSFSLPLEFGGRRTDYPLNLGLIGISGATEVGKSTFTRALSKLISVRRLLAVEPADTPDELIDVPCFSSADAALVEVVRQHYYVDSTVLHALDSLRAPLFETDGPAGEKGVIMPFFTQLTRVSNALAASGITLLATVNPMNEDKDFTKSFLSKLSAALPTTILLESYDRQGSSEVFTGTISSRPNRAKRTFTLHVDGAPREKQPVVAEISFDPSNSANGDNFAATALTNATRKVI